MFLTRERSLVTFITTLFPHIHPHINRTRYSTTWGSSVVFTSGTLAPPIPKRSRRRRAFPLCNHGAANIGEASLALLPLGLLLLFLHSAEPFVARDPLLHELAPPAAVLEHELAALVHPRQKGGQRHEKGPHNEVHEVHGEFGLFGRVAVHVGGGRQAELLLRVALVEELLDHAVRPLLPNPPRLARVADVRHVQHDLQKNRPVEV
mmetsp:Transcript_45612/g.77489  ORF Transcript_45612/g.77489 Transcript_45612/m.77489 type:complete len:206 (-) Transcript_45612:700-1317(-)